MFPSVQEGLLSGSYTYVSGLSSGKVVMGIDEAGRGPVLGPLVLGTCFATVDKYTQFCGMGFNGRESVYFYTLILTKTLLPLIHS